MKTRYTLFGLVLTLLVTGLSLASSSGRNDARAGAPGDISTCSQCHSSTGGNGTISLVEPPASVVAGNTYTLTLRLEDDNNSTMTGGFQIVATDGTSNEQVGEFGALNGEGTRVSPIDRLVQSQPKDFADGAVDWTFDWTAPAELTSEEVVFYFVGNAANDDGSNGDGDFTRTGSLNIPFMTEPSSLFEARQENAQLAVYPNPAFAGDDLNVNVVTEEQIPVAWLQILDLNGRLLQTQTTSLLGLNNSPVRLNTTNMTPGIYLVRLSGPGIVSAAQTVIMR